MKVFAHTVFRNSIWNLVAQFAIKLLSFTFSVLIIRNLGADDYGQFSAVLAFVATFAILSDLGLGTYTVRQVARWREDPEGHELSSRLYSNVIALRLLLSLLTIAVVTLAAWLTGRPWIMIGAIALNAAGLLLYAIQGASDALLAGHERLDVSAKAKIIYQIAFVAIGGIALWWLGGYYGLLVANLIGLSLMTYVCWRGVQKLGIKTRLINRKEWPALVRASLSFGVIGLALGLSYKFDSVLLNIFRGDAETGYYNAAYNLVFSATLFSNAFNTSLYPSLTRGLIGAPEKLPKIFERAFQYLLIVSLPIATGIWLFAKPLVLLLYEESYSAMIPVLQIIIWTVPLMFSSEFLGYIVLITDREKYAARAVIISTGINIGMNLWLIPRFGFVAAAIMTVTTEAVLVVQYLWTLRELLPKVDWGHCLFRPILAVTIMGAVAFILHHYLPTMLNILISGGVYLIALLVLRLVGEEELHFFQRIIKREKASVIG